jgi:hypothetical protein
MAFGHPPATGVSPPQTDSIRAGQEASKWGKLILAIFRRRYLSEKSVTAALVTLVQRKFPPASLERLLYFHSARADRLLHDAVTDVLLNMKQRGLMDIAVHDFQRPLERWVEQGKTVSSWSETTIIRVAQELLATLRDFSVLEGASPVHALQRGTRCQQGIFRTRS